MTSHDLGQLAPCVLECLDRGGRLLAMQPVERVARMQVDGHVIAEGDQSRDRGIHRIEPRPLFCLRRKPRHDVFRRHRQANMGHAGLAKFREQLQRWRCSRTIDPAVRIEAAGQGVDGAFRHGMVKDGTGTRKIRQKYASRSAKCSCQPIHGLVSVICRVLAPLACLQSVRSDRRRNCHSAVSSPTPRFCFAPVPGPGPG